MKAPLLAAFGLFLMAPRAVAAPVPGSLSFGFQGGLALARGDDLRVTTGSGLSLELGAHATWDLDGLQALRPRLDLLTFREGHQNVKAPLPQQMDTKVRGLALGGEYLFRPGGRESRWAAGPGLYLVRWSVESINRVTLPSAGTAQASGTSHWTRAGFGLAGTGRLTPHLEAEARWTFSHYGYENLPVSLGTVGLLFRF